MPSEMQIAVSDGILFSKKISVLANTIKFDGLFFPFYRIIPTISNF
ncbi:hypothetical protein [Neisseria bergeri]|nr:hypothetical protein [Neisseria bergeri]